MGGVEMCGVSYMRCSDKTMRGSLQRSLGMSQKPMIL